MIPAVLIVLVSLFIYIKWRQTYWKRQGIVQIDPISIFGISKKNYDSSFTESVLENYSAIKATGAKHGGVYFFIKPVYMPIDPIIIKHILQQDFNHFTDHGLYHHPKDIFTMNLFCMEGDSWKQLRAKLTPAFTSGKIKMMFETLVEKTAILEKQINKHAEEQTSFAAKDILEKFTMDIIASCAFGIENNSLEDPDNEFRKHGHLMLAPTLENKIRFVLTTVFSGSVLANLGFRVHGSETRSFFSNLVRDTIRNRETNEVFRKDFMHLLLQLKNQGAISDSKNIKGDTVKKGLTITEDEIIAQCYLFFLAGFETSATTMTFALYEIAQNQDVQFKVRREINDVLKKHGDKVTYDAIMEMSYLEKVIYETLRKYPPAVFLPRVCTKSYRIPGTDFTIEKGTSVQIPAWGLQMDPEYYPNPEVFNPDNFTEENRAKRPDMTFIPFGEGPRMCIGIKFGLVQTKVGLISMLRRFKISLNKKTASPLKMNAASLVLSPEGDIWLDVTKI